MLRKNEGFRKRLFFGDNSCGSRTIQQRRYLQLVALRNTRAQQIIRRISEFDLGTRPVAGRQSGARGKEHGLINFLVVRKTNFRFCGMDVDVRFFRIDPDMQETHGEFADHDTVFISVIQRRRGRRDPDAAPVHKEILHIPVRPVGKRPGDIALDRNILKRIAAGKQRVGDLFTVYCKNRLFQIAAAGCGQHAFFVAEKRELHFGMRQRRLCNGVRHVIPLGNVFFQKFHASRRIVKQIPHDDSRSDRTACALHFGGCPARNGESRPLLFFWSPCQNGKSGYRRNGRKRLPPETERKDRRKVVPRADFTGRVADERSGNVRARNAAAVIGHADIFHTAVFYFNGDMIRPGVYCVFHKLLHNGERTFHDLSGSDQLGHFLGQNSDLRHKFR